MPISYNSGTNLITVTGYSAATPCNFTDIYNADVSGGWGKVTRQCTDQFCITAGVEIGDGSTTTWFKDTNKTVRFTAYTAGYRDAMCTMAGGNCQIGEVLDATSKTGKNGCSLYFMGVASNWGLTAQGSGNLKIYNSFMTGEITLGCGSSNSGQTGNLTVWNTKFDNTLYVYTANDDIAGNYVNCGERANTYGLAVKVGSNVDDITIVGTKNRGAMSLARPGTITVSNCYLRNNDYAFICWGGYLGATPCYVINIDTDTWAINWWAAGQEIVYRQYELDLKVADAANVVINGATVKIWDKDDSLVTNTTTNSSGVLATQTLNYGNYTQAGGSTPTMKTPHEMRIYKYGKSMLSSKSTIENKTDWALTMHTDDHITQTTEATVAAYTGITINHTTETITISSNHTLDEIYDYCQYDIIAATKQLDQTVHTADGINFVSEYSFVVNTGVTVTATDQKLSMVSGETYTLTGTAQFTGIIATTTTTRIPVKLTNIIDGSRYWVGKESDGSKIFEGTQSGSGTVTGYYEHTANTNIDIRVRKSSTSVKYKPWIGEGTLIAEVFSLRIRQIQDGIVT